MHEIKKRLPDYELTWMTDKGSTVYNNKLKSFSEQYIDIIIEKANLNPFFWKKISRSFDLERFQTFF